MADLIGGMPRVGSVACRQHAAACHASPSCRGYCGEQARPDV